MPLSKVLRSVAGGEVVPHYLTERDHPWLRSLLDEFQEFAGQPRRELEARLRQWGFLHAAPARERVDLAAHVLFQLVGTRVAEACLPAETRLELFELAAEMDPPELALVEVAERLGLEPADVGAKLFADLPEERLVQPVPPDLHPGAVALAANLAQAQALVRRATHAQVWVAQRSRALVRAVQLWGLLCDVKEFSRRGTLLEIRGTLARTRTTTRYGHAIGRLLPLLPWCAGTAPGGTGTGSAPRPVASDGADAVDGEPDPAPAGFALRARCRLGNQELWFKVRAGDPLPAAPEPRAFDSKVEEQFASELHRAAPHLELTREPEPIPMEGGFVFPDFRIRDPAAPDHSCLVEIIGFWTEEYLRKKMASLHLLARSAAPGEPWILCVDGRRRSVERDLPQHMQIVWYKRRIEVSQVLAAWRAAWRAECRTECRAECRAERRAVAVYRAECRAEYRSAE